MGAVAGWVARMNKTQISDFIVRDGDSHRNTEAKTQITRQLCCYFSYPLCTVLNSWRLFLLPSFVPLPTVIKYLNNPFVHDTKKPLPGHVRCRLFTTRIMGSISNIWLMKLDTPRWNPQLVYWLEPQSNNHLAGSRKGNILSTFRYKPAN